MASLPRPAGIDDLFPWALRLISELTRRERRWASGVVELTANSATTDVSDERIRLDDVVMLSPASLAAAEDAVPARVDDTSVENGLFTITHANSAVSGRKYYYLATRRDGA